MTEIDVLIQRYGSIRKAAKVLGVNHMTVWRWAKGTHKPSPMAMEKIKTLLHIGKRSS